MHFFLRLFVCIAALTGLGTVPAQEQEPSLDISPDSDLPAVEAEASPPVDIWDRIRRGFSMPRLESPKVREALQMYLDRPGYINRVTERSGKYLYHIVEEVESRGMPTELALLPFVESAFQPEALSRAKAAGLWQFMPATGKTFSLRQNLWLDERRDVMESTRAALDYFEKLYGMFGDWHLALAAYNWGEGSVQRAVRRASARGKPADYMHLRMPRETARYVPKLEAVRQIIQNPEKFGISLPEIENEPYFVRVTKSRDIDTRTAAALAELDETEFRQLNPGFNLPVIVASHRSAMLLPADNLEIFLDNLAGWVSTGKPLSCWLVYRVRQGDTLASIATMAGMKEEDLRSVNHIPPNRQVMPGSVLLVDAQDKLAPEIDEDALDAALKLSPAPSSRRSVVYRVRRGDTLFAISRRFGVTQDSLRRMNRLKSSQLKIGQRLVVSVSAAPRGGTAARSAARPVSGTDARGSVRENTYTIYRVRKGDTLFSIARRYRTTVSDLRKLNGLGSNIISPGQRLRVR